MQRIYQMLVAMILVWIEKYVTGETRRSFWDKQSRKTVESVEEPQETEDSDETITVEELDRSRKKGGKGQEAPGVPVVIDRLVRTFLMVLTRKDLLASIYIDDTSYRVEEYVFPSTFWEIARARTVYLSRSARETCDPIFKLDIKGELDTTNLMSPSDVKLFFDRFNKNQEASTTINVEGPDIKFEECATISDLRACMSNGQLGDLNEDGTVSPMVTQILDISFPWIPEDVVNTCAPYHERSLAKWLLSTKRSTVKQETSTSKEE